MGVVSIVGLLAPALDEGSVADVALGLAIGVAFMLATRRYLASTAVTVQGRQGEGVRSSVLVFAVLLVHSFPEGLAMGTAFASNTAGLGLYVIVAIALQNIPEGTSVAIPMEAAGFSRAQQFWAAVVTSVPQPDRGGRRLLARGDRSTRCCRCPSHSRRARCSRSSCWSCCHRR